jgi:hypothetical protein
LKKKKRKIGNEVGKRSEKSDEAKESNYGGDGYMFRPLRGHLQVIR